MAHKDSTSFLNDNCISWAWDITDSGNKDTLVSELDKYFGPVAVELVSELKEEHLPALVICGRRDGRNHIMDVMNGTSTREDVLQALKRSKSIFDNEQVEDIGNQIACEERAKLLQEQKLAYEASLAADKLKAQIKKKEQEQRQREEEEQKKKEEEAKLAEEKRLAECRSAAAILSDEPPLSCQEPIATIRFRCPGSGLLNRRFLLDDPLKMIFLYVTSQGYCAPEGHKILTAFPKLNLCDMNPQQTLRELKLGSKIMLTVAGNLD